LNEWIFILLHESKSLISVTKCRFLISPILTCFLYFTIPANQFIIPLISTFFMLVSLNFTHYLHNRTTLQKHFHKVISVNWLAWLIIVESFWVAARWVFLKVLFFHDSLNYSLYTYFMWKALNLLNFGLKTKKGRQKLIIKNC